MYDIVNTLSNKFLDLVIIILVAVAGVDVSHQVNEQMWDLIDELERFAVLKNNFLLLLLFVSFSILLFIVLPFVGLVVWIFGVLAQSNQKLSFVFQKFKELQVVLFCVQSHGSGSSLGAFVDLLDKGINGFAGLNGYIFFLFEEVAVELVEEVRVVFGADEVPLEDFEDHYLFLGGMLTFGEGAQKVSYDFFLEA